MKLYRSIFLVLFTVLVVFFFAGCEQDASKYFVGTWSDESLFLEEILTFNSNGTYEYDWDLLVEEGEYEAWGDSSSGTLTLKKGITEQGNHKYSFNEDQTELTIVFKGDSLPKIFYKQ